jgi:hypothetical protein
MISGSRLAHALSPNEFRERLDAGSIIFFPYVLTIAWQYFCVIQNKPLAWTCAVIVSLVAWYVCNAFKEASPEKLSWQFWPIVALPLLFIFLLRVSFPDISFDVLNYHIFHSERALRGALFIPGDFFPTPAPFNPSPDILTGLYRYLLGYRLGTIVNYLALIWTGAILNQLLRDYVRSAWLRSLSVLFILCTEQILFQINNYMVDLLALPLVLEATLLAITPGRRGNGQPEMRRTAMLAMWLGIAAAFKLANLIIAVPLVLVYVFELVVRNDSRGHRILATLKSLPVSALLFLAPFAPFMIVIYRLTGNPVFPLYNGIFKSPYWPQGAVFDPRWGPWGLYETIVWPVLMWFKPARLSEFPHYAGRLSIGYVAAGICLLIARGNRNIRIIAFTTLLGSILWSASSGYIRYALFLELTSGILLIWLVQTLWKKSAQLSNVARLLVPVPLCLLLLAHSYLALRYSIHWEWSTRGTALIFGRSFRHESRNLLRDGSLRSYLSPQDQTILDQVDVFVETTYKTSAFAALLKPDHPVMGLRIHNFFSTNLAREKFSQILEGTRGQRLFTLTNRESKEEARALLAARGLTMGKTQAVSIPYFSDSLRFEMLLVEVLPSWQNNSAQAQPVKGLPLADMAFKARLSVVNLPEVMRAGQKYSIRVMLRNESKVVWPGRQQTWQYQLTVGNRWLTEGGAKISDLDGRTALSRDLAPSETVEIPLTVTAPNAAGSYILQLDAIQEGVAWFGDRGSDVLSLKIKVE